MEYKPLLIRLLEDDYDWLDQHSFDTKLSKAEIIRRGLDLYREKEAKTMTKLGWEVIEDGGGGLCLFVFDGDKGVYVDRMGAAGKNGFFTTAMRIAELLGNDGQCWGDR